MPAVYDCRAMDRLLDLMLTARLAEELAKPEAERVSEHGPSKQFAWNWGTRVIGGSTRHWVRISWYGKEFEETAQSKDQAARRLLLMHMDPENEEEAA